MKRIKSPRIYNIYKKKIPTLITPVQDLKAQTYIKNAICQGNAANFFSARDVYNVQAHPAFCGLTTLSNMLNAANIDPKKIWNELHFNQLFPF